MPVLPLADRHRASWRHASCLVLALSCGGCALLPSRVYEPGVVEGSTSRGACRSRDEIVFDRSPVEIRARVVPRTDARRMIEMTVAVADGHRARIESAEVTLFDEADVASREATRFTGIASIQTPDAHLQPVGMVMKGEGFSVGRRDDVHRRYWLYAPLAVDDKVFSVLLPALTIDGKRTELPAIRFTRKLRWSFFAQRGC